MPNLTRNRLLDRLSAEDRAAVLAESTLFAFPVGHVFSEPGDAVTHIHFIRSGVVSAVASMEDGRTMETFMIGREGATDVWATETPVRGFSRLVAQIAGESWRIEVGRLKALMESRPTLRQAIAAYAGALQSELEQSIACNALHRAEQRFAKWLLRCNDRIESNTLHLTQEFFAGMLGSQRSTVNEAAQALQRAGAIAYSRGKMAILNRGALERAACECYHHAALAKAQD